MKTSSVAFQRNSEKFTVKFQPTNRHSEFKYMKICGKVSGVSPTHRYFRLDVSHLKQWQKFPRLKHIVACWRFRTDAAIFVHH
jgi:hypothetical protein